MPFQSVEGEMRRFKRGELHSGKGGKVVTSRKQAIAIALSEKRRAKKHKAEREGAKRTLTNG